MIKSHQKIYDIFIIGGGINGCGLARDAAGRGFNVCLAEMNDLASGTSSMSTKLIHGGLRYLEQFAFHLVREGLEEREILWKIAPHIIKPLRFILPCNKGIISEWILRIGLFIYDHLGKRKDLYPTKKISFNAEYGNPLKKIYSKGFEYSDTQVDDSRLVILNARHAKILGATIMTRTEVIEIFEEDKKWHIILLNKITGEKKKFFANFVINMSGPWINMVMKNISGINFSNPIRLVKGSHIVVKALYDHDRAYIFQNNDGRVIFSIPYYENYTLIGTTDLNYHGNPSNVNISKEEIKYLCNASNRYFNKSINTNDIIWSFSGVRQLYDDGKLLAQKITRDYILKIITPKNMPPILNIYGGKITTYRRLAEEAMCIVEKYLGKKKSCWTKNIPLPGGNFPHDNILCIEQAILNILPKFNKNTVKRLARSYGTDSLIIYYNNCCLGKYFGCGLYEKEVKWMIKEEWAYTKDDILWRRSKLGLYFNKEQRKNLDIWLKDFFKK